LLIPGRYCHRISFCAGPRDRALSLAILSGRYADSFLEVAQKMALITDPDRDPDLFYAQKRAFQKLLGTPESQRFKVLRRSGSGRSLEEVTKVTWRNVDGFSQLAERERLL